VSKLFHTKIGIAKTDKRGITLTLIISLVYLDPAFRVVGGEGQFLVRPCILNSNLNNWVGNWVGTSLLWKLKFDFDVIFSQFGKFRIEQIPEF